MPAPYRSLRYELLARGDCRGCWGAGNMNSATIVTRETYTIGRGSVAVAEKKVSEGDPAQRH